ncbi:MAG TPA: hypothetical protein VMU17_07290, partial [Elusimicrobiota bacterium]|nr:hypothetical protein [Elusimicrobiota bacterium]
MTIQPLSQRLRAVLAALIIGGSFAAFYFLTPWSVAAGWVRAFAFKDQTLTLLEAALTVGFLRRFVLLRRPRWIGVFVCYALVCGAVFHSRWLPPGALPTYLMILLFYHLTALALVFGLDAATDLLARLNHSPQLSLLRMPIARFALLWALALGYLALLRPNVSTPWLQRAHANLFAWLVGMPAVSAWVRRRFGARPASYAP